MEGTPPLTATPEVQTVEDYLEDLLDYSFDDLDDEGVDDYSDL